MSGHPLAAYLEEFEIDEPTPMDFPFDDEVEPVAPMPMPMFGEAPAGTLDPETVGAKIEEMYERGLQEGREEAMRAFEAQLAEREEAFAQERAEASERAQQDLERLATGFVGAVDDMRRTISECVSDILRRFLLASVAERSLQSLIDALDRVLQDPATPAVEIQGPDPLVSALAERVRAQNISAVCTPGDTIDVKLRVGRGTIELRLAEWMAALSEPEDSKHG